MPAKNKRQRPRPTIHPRNKYSDNPPDFAHLASLYPSFEPYVFYSRQGRPTIDWTDYNATRELTRILLLHDHGLNWWIPDGQLCPTVPNRSNYIHWIEDLLASDVIPTPNHSRAGVKGFDIGTGANCIYPLLGASLRGWSFVGSDVTDVALEWAERNVKSNPSISSLIEIRRVSSCQDEVSKESQNDELVKNESNSDVNSEKAKEMDLSSYCGPPILMGVVKEGETFDFCMCNPPFFETIEEGGLNPKTSCGGTSAEMVCQGGEQAFISQIVEDSVALKQSFRWYTSMIGRKANLKLLISKLREVKVTIVKTTEFVQGQTCRWGLAWSFVPPARKIVAPHVVANSAPSFMLEGLQRQFSAMHVLQSIESYFQTSGANCKLNATSFVVDITASENHCNAFLKNETHDVANVQEISGLQVSPINLCFRVSVFQQIPGTLLVKGSLQHRDSPLSGLFSSLFQHLEEMLKLKFCKKG